MSTHSIDLFLPTVSRKLRSICLTGLVLLGGACSWAQTDSASPYYFTTIAGAASIGSTDGPGTAARFFAPGGVAIDSQGNLFLVDTRNHTIRKITPAGIVSTLAGKPGVIGDTDGTGNEARLGFNGQNGIAIDQMGNLYVANQWTIRKISASGLVTTLAGSANAFGTADGIGSAARFTGACGIALDATGNLYVTDSWGIRKVTQSGVVTTIAGLADTGGSADGTGSAARFSFPRGITADTAGNLFVTDTQNNTIRKITPLGVVTTLAGTAGVSGSADGAGGAARFNYPVGIAIDATGNLFVCDQANQTIRKITPSGVVTTVSGAAGLSGDADGSGSAARFGNPGGITVDATGDLYVGDSENNTIRKITPAGTVSTVAGLSPQQSIGHVDGTGTIARFDGITGVALDNTGILYVADSANGTVRKVTVTGVVTTLAGLADTAGFAEGVGSAARFDGLSGVAVDADGNVYATDTNNSVVRRITPAGVVSTYAGQPGRPGPTDGPSGIALLDHPESIAMGTDNNLYVTSREIAHDPYLNVDYQNQCIRKISPNGQISTFFRAPIRPHQPTITGLAIDGAGNVLTVAPYEYNLYVISPAGAIVAYISSSNLGAAHPTSLAIDRLGNAFFGGITATVSKISPVGAGAISLAGSQETIGGRFYAWGSADGIGSNARFGFNPQVGAVDAAGNLYLFDETSVRKGQPAGPPSISTQPQSQTVAASSNVQFSVTAGAVPAPTYQWFFNGNAFGGATTNTLSFTSARTIDAGDYTVIVTNELGSVTSNKATLTISAAPATPPTTPAPVSSAGGGAIEGWFVLAVIALGGTSRVAARRNFLSPVNTVKF